MIIISLFCDYITRNRKNANMVSLEKYLGGWRYSPAKGVV